MAWSENARRAALEARRRKRKTKVVVKQGKYSAKVPRADYAAYLKEARQEARNRWGRHSSSKRRNRWARESTKTTVIDEGY